MLTRYLVPACSVSILIATLLLVRSKVVGEDANRPSSEKADVAQAADIDPTKEKSLLAFTKVTIPAAEFSAQPLPGADAQSRAFFLRGFGYFRGGGTGGPAYAPVTLPQGVTVKAVFAFLYDNDTQATAVRVSLSRLRNRGGENAQTMATLSTNGNSSSVQIPSTSTITNAVIDGDYSYYLETFLSSDRTRLYAVYVFYE